MSGFKKIHLVEDSCVYEIYLKNDSKAQQTLDPLKEKSEQALDWLKKKKMVHICQHCIILANNK